MKNFLIGLSLFLIALSFFVGRQYEKSLSEAVSLEKYRDLQADHADQFKLIATFRDSIVAQNLIIKRLEENCANKHWQDFFQNIHQFSGEKIKDLNRKREIEAW